MKPLAGIINITSKNNFTSITILKTSRSKGEILEHSMFNKNISKTMHKLSEQNIDKSKDNTFKEKLTCQWIC